MFKKLKNVCGLELVHFKMKNYDKTILADLSCLLVDIGKVFPKTAIKITLNVWQWNYQTRKRTYQNMINGSGTVHYHEDFIYKIYSMLGIAEADDVKIFIKFKVSLYYPRIPPNYEENNDDKHYVWKLKKKMIDLRLLRD